MVEKVQTFEFVVPMVVGAMFGVSSTFAWLLYGITHISWLVACLGARKVGR